ncbi:MAG: glycoside hydrolase family 3 N-terminal domain-containing protein [Novosphingobium sp.]
MSEADVKQRADALLRQMTPEEKAAQLTTLFALPPMQKLVDQAAATGAGSFLFVTDPKETNRLQHLAVEKTRLKIPRLFGFAVIHGLTTIVPVPIGQAASWDPAMVEADQAVAAAESRAVGIAWSFAPMVDIARDPRWGRIVEGAGEDPYLGSAMAAAQVRGFQGDHVGAPGHIIAGPKHFAAYGAAVGGRDYEEANVSDADLWNVYLPPFKAAVDAGAGNIMSAYMPLNGIPATGNHWLLTDVLRKTWGFKGWVVSDAEAVNDIKTHGYAIDAQEASAKAVSAGLDMEMALFNPAMKQLPRAVAAGQVGQAAVDTAVRRVLEAKLRMGLFEHPFVDEAAAAKVLTDPEHLALARHAAARSAVLLRNEGALLPLDRARLHSVALIGALADSPRDMLGPWVFPQNAPPTKSLRAALAARLGPKVALNYAPGVTIPARFNPSPFAFIESTFAAQYKRPAPADDGAGIAEAVAQARLADVAIVVVGEAADQIGENASRSSMALPGRQQELLDAVVATGKPVVVLVMNGRPLDLGETKAGAILDIWYPGSAGGAAVSFLLLGDEAPGGRLPFTWPRNAGQLPLYYAHLTTHAPASANKRYWNESNAPRYPFGYGLSYSSFAYAAPMVDRAKIAPGESVTVSVDVRNTGGRIADEVAQLYIHQRSGTAARPVRELKGFQRLTLKPGETRSLHFRLGPDELHYWNTAKRDWVQDSSVFDVAIGGDSTAAFAGSFVVSR